MTYEQRVKAIAEEMAKKDNQWKSYPEVVRISRIEQMEGYAKITLKYMADIVEETRFTLLDHRRLRAYLKENGLIPSKSPIKREASNDF